MIFLSNCYYLKMLTDLIGSEKVVTPYGWLYLIAFLMSLLERPCNFSLSHCQVVLLEIVFQCIIGSSLLLLGRCSGYIFLCSSH